MNLKDTLAGIGGLLILGALLLLGVAVTAVFILGAAWATTKLLPWFTVLTLVSFGLVIFVVLPLAVPKTTRGFSSVALLVASYVFGATLWMEGLLFTLAIWGLGAVVIGILLVGVGVVPIAMLATLFNGMWGSLLELVPLTFMTFGSRIGAMWLAATVDS
jgi:hypothetical protein